MNDLQPQQIARLQSDIKGWKRRAKDCATAGNNGDKEIIDCRIQDMENELALLLRQINGGGLSHD